jgi:SAM-dependent methyltransferase
VRVGAKFVAESVQEPRYPRVVIDPRAYNDPYSLSYSIIRPGSAVLDLGAWDGAYGEFLKRQLGCRVVGVEKDEQAAIRAKEVLDVVLVGDLETIDLAEALGGERFDYVTCLDVLEHLREPSQLLRKVKDVLAPSGLVVASIPNVAHASVKLALASGRFRYTKNGLLDETHLRFFDRAGVESLFESAGYATLAIRRVVRELGQTEIEVDPDSIPAEVVAFAMQDPEALTYQFVVVAAPAESQVEFELPPLAWFQDRVRELEREARRERARAEETARQLVKAEARAASARIEADRERMAREDLERQLEVVRAQVARLEQEASELRAKAERLDQIRAHPAFRLLRYFYRLARRLLGAR